MLASVLNSKIAVEASVQVVWAFVRLRQVLATHKELAAKLAELETRIKTDDEVITSAEGYYRAKSLSTVFMGRYIRFWASGKERNPYLE